MLSEQLAELRRLVSSNRTALYRERDWHEDVSFLLSELDAATQKLADYEMAARYPGDDQRHRGASVASQLVYAQHMREKAEAERDAAVQNLADADLAYDSASQEVQRQDAEIKALKAQVQRLVNAAKVAIVEARRVHAKLYVQAVIAESGGSPSVP